MKVLHITNWYPNSSNTFEGIFVKEQFEIFKKITDAQIINVQVRSGKHLLKLEHTIINNKEEAYLLLTTINKGKIIEVLTTLLLIYVLFKKKANAFDLLHFHIAYPLLRFYKIWKAFFKTKIIISEHWSAYHLNFNLPVASKKLNGIKSVFSHQIPVITVSNALKNDIHKFARRKDFKTFILPNLIDLKTFDHKEIKSEMSMGIRFFIVNVWRPIKNPFPMMESLIEIMNVTNTDIKLIIGGYGDLIVPMKKFVEDQQMEQHFIFLGKLTKDEIAIELSKADAYLFSSDYETFSVACAQALCCGVPLIGPSLEAIMEYAGNEDAIFLKANEKEDWKSAFNFFIENRQKYNRKNISQKATSRFSIEKFKEDYLNIIEEV